MRRTTSPYGIACFMVFIMITFTIFMTLPGILTVSANDDNDDNDKAPNIWGFVYYEDEYGDPVWIPNATVILREMHTGVEERTYTTSTGYSKGYYNFTAKIGTFMLETYAKGFIQTEGSKTGIFTLERGDDNKHIDLKLLKVPPALEEPITISGYVQSITTGDGINGANVTFERYLDDAYKGYTVTTTTASKTIMVGNETKKYKGYYEVELWHGAWRIWCSAESYRYNITEITLQKSLSNYNITLTKGKMRIFGMVLDEDGELVKEFDVYLWDWNYSTYLHTRGAHGIFELLVYPSNFTPFFDAPGYCLNISKNKTGEFKIIEINETRPTCNLRPILVRDTTEAFSSAIRFKNNDWDNIIYITNWTLNSDTNLYGLEHRGLGNLRLQIERQFGNGDWYLNATEVRKFKSWFSKRGPYYLYTEDFFEVNATYYEPLKINNRINFTVVELTGFIGPVDLTAPLYINATMEYESHEPLNATEYKVEIKNLRKDPAGNIIEVHNISFPAGYEIATELTSPNEKTSYSNATIRSMPTTLILKRIKAPIANITVTIDDKTYYASDEIIVGVNKNLTVDAKNSIAPVGTIENYTWTLGLPEGGYRYEQNIEYNYTTSGVKNVTLTVISSAGLKAHAWCHIKVDNTAPTPTFRILNASKLETDEVSEGETIFVDASGTRDTIDGVTSGRIPEDGYEWDFGDGTAKVTGINTTHEYKLDKTKFTDNVFTITLTVTDAVGKKATINKTIKVRDVTPPTPEFNYEPEEVNMSSPVRFNATATDDNFCMFDNLSFNWAFGDGETATGPIVYHNYSMPGIYTVSLNVTDAEGNRALRNKTVTIRGPEFVLQDLLFSRDKPMEGARIQIRVILNNTYVGGEVIPWENVTVALFVDDKRIADKIVPELPVEQDTEVIFSWVAKPGEHTIRVEVDPDNYTAEWNEQNNVMSKIIKVRRQPFNVALVVTIMVIVIVIGVFLYIRSRRRARRRRERRKPKKRRPGKKRREKGKRREVEEEIDETKKKDALRRRRRERRLEKRREKHKEAKKGGEKGRRGKKR